jgi:hypothetical protein
MFGCRLIRSVHWCLLALLLLNGSPIPRQDASTLVRCVLADSSNAKAGQAQSHKAIITPEVASIIAPDQQLQDDPDLSSTLSRPFDVEFGSAYVKSAYLPPLLRIEQHRACAAPPTGPPAA